ncbi:cupin domain-containing protein [Leucobacter sp. W1038]
MSLTSLPIAVLSWLSTSRPDPTPIVENGDALLIGLNSFDVGEEFANHFHEELNETYIGVAGELELWVDRVERIVLTTGVIVTVEPGREHFLRNASDQRALVCYIKSPNLPEDRILVSWHPEERGSKV